MPSRGWASPQHRLRRSGAELRNLGMPRPTISSGARVGEVIFKYSRPGRDGHQVFEYGIRPDGSYAYIVQRAFNAAGQRVHEDYKLGEP